MITLNNVAPTNPQTISATSRLQDLLKFMDERLQNNTWLAGDEFTAADIMTIFSLTTMRAFIGYELTGFEAILGYLERVREREGYKRQRKGADPDMKWMGGAEKPESFFEGLKKAGKI